METEINFQGVVTFVLVQLDTNFKIQKQLTLLLYLI